MRARLLEELDLAGSSSAAEVWMPFPVPHPPTTTTHPFHPKQELGVSGILVEFRTRRVFATVALSGKTEAV